MINKPDLEQLRRQWLDLYQVKLELTAQQARLKAEAEAKPSYTEERAAAFATVVPVNRKVHRVNRALLKFFEEMNQSFCEWAKDSDK